MIEKMERFYLSKKTFWISLIGVMILLPLSMAMEAYLDDLIPYEWIAFCILYCLLIGLLITHQKRDYILMNGLVSGLLMSLFVRYVYLLELFTSEAILDYYRSAGFFVCVCFSFIFLSVTIVCIISYNHFTLNRRRAVNRTKIVLNQFLLFISLLLPIIYIFMNFALGYSIFQIIAYTAVYFSDSLVLLVVACCEFDLAINREDGTALDKLILSDIKAVLWYAVSFLFALLCISLTLLLQNTEKFIYVLNFLDFFLSLGLLIYYLNKKKKPSNKLLVILYVGLITTIGLMAFSIAYFVWTNIV